MKKGHVFFDEDSEGSSNGGGGKERLCVEQKVHLEHGWGWYDQTGCEKDAYDGEEWRVIGPCDNSCVPFSDLPAEAEELVKKFFATGEKEVWEKNTPRYTRESHPWLFQ